MSDGMRSDEPSREGRGSGLRAPDESGSNPAGATADGAPAVEDAALVVEGLRKSFRGPAGGALEVLRGASLVVGPGEAAAVVGASGAGKTTLLQVLGGLERADGGSARLGPFDILAADGAALAAWRGREVGFVFQSHRLLADLTAEENVALPLRIARRGACEAQAAAREMLARVGLSERARHAAGELSGGEQQRVAVARALVARPRLVLADEPTGNLDARTGAEVSALLVELCRGARACLLVATHNSRLADACDRTLTLRDGRLHETP
ncbi:MAG TPA: ABC transporter ATP-binding protein [Pyrinomonadaceae bacterium]|nr:ABC transporter ATP-binding protein [Pyrinomonadaceae bacterium]